MVKFVTLGILFLATICFVTAKNECDELKEQELQLKCEFTDFEEYRKCVKERKELRRKRATICPITGQKIDIGKLSGNSDQFNVRSNFPIISPTAAIPSIQPQAVVPPAVVADQPLYARPAPQAVFDARQAEVNHNWIVEGKDTNYVHTQRYLPARNVTTVIKLTNHINNTNIVNVPTHINATNINNITLFTNSSENTQDFGFGYTKDGPCCMVVKPKTCHTTPMGPRCHHRRHKMCGQQCTSRIMHVRSQNHHQHHGISYVPQPSPRCIYTNQWPYVNCGYRRRDPCDGCYEHYDNYNYGYYEPPSSCRGCYDEGFEYGQMYRRGPVLRPHYFHKPPPYYEPGYQGYGNYYGDDFYNQGGYMPYPEPPPYYSRPEIEPPYFEDDNSPEIHTSSGEKRNGTSKEEGDWGIAMQKCKVISSDGSITIANCTVENDHPYASAPSDFSYPTYNGYESSEYYKPTYYRPHRGIPIFRRPITNHKIAPLVSRKNSQEILPRPIDDDEENEDDVDQKGNKKTKADEKGDLNKGDQKENEKETNEKDYDYETDQKI